MPLGTHQLPEKHDRLDEARFTIADRQRRTIDRLARHLPKKYSASIETARGTRSTVACPRRSWPWAWCKNDRFFTDLWNGR